MLGALLLTLLFYWLFITTEGVFLGRRVVVWLYDITAQRYDAIKEYDADDEMLLVVRPVLYRLRGQAKPLLLDVATGTGRVPYDLLDGGAFQGQIVALDDSRKMLDVAQKKLAPFADRVKLIHHPAVPLPFGDSQFDMVTCLEALEFFPSDEAALAEMVRVLKPDGHLMVTRRRGLEGRAFLHRYRTEETVQEMLQTLGLEEVRIFLWQLNYDLVTAHKPVEQATTGASADPQQEMGA